MKFTVWHVPNINNFKNNIFEFSFVMISDSCHFLFFLLLLFNVHFSFLKKKNITNNNEGTVLKWCDTKYWIIQVIIHTIAAREAWKKIVKNRNYLIRFSLKVEHCKCALICNYIHSIKFIEQPTIFIYIFFFSKINGHWLTTRKVIERLWNTFNVYSLSKSLLRYSFLVFLSLSLSFSLLSSSSSFKNINRLNIAALVVFRRAQRCRISNFYSQHDELERISVKRYCRSLRVNRLNSLRHG